MGRVNDFSGEWQSFADCAITRYMFVVTVYEPGGEYYSLVFEKHEVSIGRTEDNDIVLNDDSVSQRHGRISLRGGKFILVDNNSTNGIYVNDCKVSAPMMITGPDDIQIANFVLQLSKIRK
ncbi:MAG: FHA domain-containing protein [Kofleriaceae bacterium]|nr:FHA domain-containing protein [Kofleriaceae bacterium]